MTTTSFAPLEDRLDWLSVHLFFNGNIYDESCDYILEQVLIPFIQMCRQHHWIERYFFIRYSEEGAHIRLRLEGEPAVLTSLVKPAFTARATEAAARSTAKLSWRWIPYEPEVARYGGEEATKLAETYFYYSSDIALRLLPEIKGSQSARLGKALLLMSVLGYLFLPDRTEAATFFRDYTTGYLRLRIRDDALQAAWINRFTQGFNKQSTVLATYVDEVWQRLETAVPLSDTLDQFMGYMTEIQTQFHALFEADLLIRNESVLTDWYECVRSIISSYVHMMNNRLGVTIEEESYLSYLMAQTLDPSVVFEMARAHAGNN